MPDPWKIKIENASIESAPVLPFPEKRQVEALRTKLTAAVRIASEMAVAAKTAIGKLAVVPQGMTMHGGHAEVMNALIKYFSLHPKDRLYARTVQRIVTVYGWVVDGLSADYQLCVYTAPDKSYEMANATGYCNVFTGANAALGRLFLSDGHVDWDQFQALAKGDRSSATSEQIHLKYEFLIRPDVTVDKIAHTIVHEASHKWAYTTDVCYKHNTIAKVKTKEGLQGAVRQGFQASVERLGDHDPSMWENPEEGAAKKVIYPMAKEYQKVPSLPGEMKLKSANRMEAEMLSLSKTDMWVKNADSYAWAARRVWKREPIIAVAATGGRSASLGAI